MALISVYLGGSSCILPQARDIDLIYIYETQEEAREALIHNKRRDSDCHFASLEKELGKVCLRNYQYPFMRLVQGKSILEIENYSIFEHEQECVEFIKGYFSWLPLESKWWYHIYFYYEFFKNGNLELTNEILNTAQEIHDNGVSSEMRDIIVDFFNKKSYQ